MENVITEDPTTIEVNVLLELNDCLRANYWFLFKRYWHTVILLSVVGVLLPILSAAGLMTPKGDPPPSFSPGWFIPLGLLAFLLIGTYISTKRSLSSHKGLQKRIRYRFSPRGIETDSVSLSGYNSWENIREAFETKHNFLLFISRNQMYAIPKGCFANADEIANLRTLLSQSLGKKARIKRA